MTKNIICVICVLLKATSVKKSSFVMNPNHIVFFTQLYYPDMTTTAIIMTDLVEDLASYGMNTKVVCAQPTYVKNSDPQITQITRIKGRVESRE